VGATFETHGFGSCAVDVVVAAAVLVAHSQHLQLSYLQESDKVPLFQSFPFFFSVKSCK
jgi:hypothetical protein